MTSSFLSPTTLAAPVTFRGPGIFNPASATLTLHPAPARHGVTFRRTDLPGQPDVPATTAHVLPRPRHTVLAAGPAADAAAAIHTTEHLLSALHALGVTDARCELTGSELPMLDASADAFARGLITTGFAKASDERRATSGKTDRSSPSSSLITHRSSLSPLTLSSPITIADAHTSIEAHPNPNPTLELTYHLDYAADIPAQSASFTLDYAHPDPAAYLRDIAPARTFCTLAEAEQFRRQGFFTHLAPHDVLVIGPNGPVDTEERFPSEPARHKVLDMLGDLFLAARPIYARIIARRTGHAHNHALARAILAQNDRAS